MPRRDPSNQILASVLFTDIVGSTETASRLGDRGWKQLLAKHHTVMRKELKRFRGKEMDTAGDGFFATFDQPADAIRCAVAVSERLAPLDVHIRAGVHIGQVEVGGPKVQGIAVAIGARVMAKAQGDEVLVSSTVRDALAGADIAFEDRGTYELKGVPGEWHLFAVERSDALVARALGNEPVEAPGDGGTPVRPWYRQTGALVAIAAATLIAVVAGVLLSRGDGTPPFEPNVNTVIALDPSDASVVTGASVGDAPLAVAASDENVWVTNFNSGTVSKIDPTGETADQQLVVIPGGNPVAVTLGGDAAWVAIAGTGRAVNEFTNTSTPKSYPLDSGLVGITYGDGIVWAVDKQRGDLWKIDPATGTEPERFHLLDGGGFEGIAFGDGSLWLAAGLGNKTILRVDPATGEEVDRIDLAGDPKGIAFGEGSVWVTIPDLDQVKRIDPDQGEQVTIDKTGFDGPEAIAVADGEAWVTFTNSRTVVRIDASTNTPSEHLTLDQGLAPEGIAIGAGYVWVTVTAP
jgi:class 3 adenylate cyclase/streptogramin lyase